MAKTTKKRDLTRKDDINPFVQEVLHSVKSEISLLRAAQQSRDTFQQDMTNARLPDGRKFGGYVLALTARGALRQWKAQLLADYGIDADRGIENPEAGDPDKLIPIKALLDFLPILSAHDIVAQLDQAEEAARIAGIDVEEALRNAYFEATKAPNWRYFFTIMLTPSLPEGLRSWATVSLASMLLSTISLGANPRLSAAIASEAGGTSYDRLILETVNALPFAGYDYLTKKPRKPRKDRNRQDDNPEMIEFRRLRNLATRTVEKGTLPRYDDAVRIADGEEDLRARMERGGEKFPTDGTEHELGTGLAGSGMTRQELHATFGGDVEFLPDGSEARADVLERLESQDYADAAALQTGLRHLKLGASAEQWAMQHEAQRQVIEAIKASDLTPRELEVTRLRHEGYSPKETADALQISVKTVRTLLARADAKVKAVLAKIDQN